MKATRCYQDPQQSSAHVWEGSSSHCKATESTSPQLCCRPHGIPLRLEAAQGEARHRGAGRTALVVLAPLLSAASPPKNGEHSWARSWDRWRWKHESFPATSIHPKEHEGKWERLPLQPQPSGSGHSSEGCSSPAGQDLAEGPAQQTPVSGEEPERLGLCTQPWPTSRTVCEGSAAPTPYPSGTGPR